jgi:hypothetical protein
MKFDRRCAEYLNSCYAGLLQMALALVWADASRRKRRRYANGAQQTAKLENSVSGPHDTASLSFATLSSGLDKPSPSQSFIGMYTRTALLLIM